MRGARLLALALMLCGCRPSQEDCGRLLDHFLDVESVAATEGKFRELPDHLKAAVGAEKARFRQSLADDFVGRCRQLLSRRELACALAATDESGMDRCEGR